MTYEQLPVRDRATGLPGWWVLLLVPALGATLALVVLLVAPGWRADESTPEPQAWAAAFPTPEPVFFQTPTPEPTLAPVPTVPPPMVGTLLPERLLGTLDGTLLQLADDEGTITFLNFWATWCAPCREEMPELQRLHDARGADDVRVIAVTDPFNGQTPEDVQAFAEAYGVTFTIALEEDPLFFAQFEAYEIPVTFITDMAGVVRFRHVGALHDHDIDAYLAVLANQADTQG